MVRCSVKSSDERGEPSAGDGEVALIDEPLQFRTRLLGDLFRRRDAVVLIGRDEQHGKCRHGGIRKVSRTVLVFAHDHRGGNVQTSEHDKVLTRALVPAFPTIQIKAFDRLIVSQDSDFCFRKVGLL